MSLKKITRAFFSLLVIAGFVGLFYLVHAQKIKLPFKIPFLDQKGSSGPITLTYWGLWEPKGVIQPLIEQYQKAHPNITVNYEMRDPKNHFQTVRSRLKSELAPDIIRVHNTWVPFLYPDLTPLPSDLIDNQTYADTFFPVTQQTLFFDNKYFGLPLEVDGLALVYNADLFAAAGLSGPPPTWDVFRDYARRLTVKNEQNQILQAGAALGSARNVDFFSDILGLMFAQNGVTFQDKDGNVTFNHSISADGRNLAAEALTFYSLFVRSEKSWDPTWENSTSAFAAGKVAMILVPSHKILDILGQNPKLKFKVARAPQLPSSSPTTETAVNWGTFWTEVVPKNAAHPRQAWEFLKFLTEKENLVALYRNALKLRTFGEPYSRSDLAQSLAADQFTKVYAQQGATYVSWYLADKTFDTLLNDKIIAALKTAVENTASGKDPAAELDLAASKIQQVLTDLTR